MDQKYNRYLTDKTKSNAQISFKLTGLNGPNVKDPASHLDGEFVLNIMDVKVLSMKN